MFFFIITDDQLLQKDKGKRRKTEKFYEVALDDIVEVYNNKIKFLKEKRKI